MAIDSDAAWPGPRCSLCGKAAKYAAQDDGVTALGEQVQKGAPVCWRHEARTAAGAYVGLKDIPLAAAQNITATETTP